MTEAADSPVVVIGSGIVGLSAAIWLARAGRAVTVIDRDGAGHENAASYGNAGVLAAGSVAPVTAPGLLAKAPGMLLNPDYPLFLRWRYLPRLAPWLMRYLAHANDADTRRIAAGLAPLTQDSVDQHRALARDTPAGALLQGSDFAFAYADRAAFEADGYAWALRREAGFVPDVLEGGAVREYEPALSEDFGCVAVMKDHGFLHRPADYIRALEQAARALGVGMRQEEVVDLALTEGRISAVITRQQRHPCGAAVLAAGAWSRALARKLGLDVPLESERGYHLHVRDPGAAPRNPVMVTSGKFVATPMGGDLRCAGVVEFGGLAAPASAAPIRFLRRQVRAAFPAVRLEDVSEWMGHRPATSDSLPVLGEIGGTGVYAGFGHHHLGMTAGPKTGRILAGLITGERVNLDLSPYRPGRFAKGQAV